MSQEKRDLFEEWIKPFPEILGGNNLAVQYSHYGVPVTEGMYDSSWVDWLFGRFCDCKTDEEREALYQEAMKDIG